MAIPVSQLLSLRVAVAVCAIARSSESLLVAGCALIHCRVAGAAMEGQWRGSRKWEKTYREQADGVDGLLVNLCEAHDCELGALE